jgi:hypothetical protein
MTYTAEQLEGILKNKGQSRVDYLGQFLILKIGE